MSTRPRLPTTVIERLEDVVALLLDNDKDLGTIAKRAERYEDLALLGAVNRLQGRMILIERKIRECRVIRPEGVQR